MIKTSANVSLSYFNKLAQQEKANKDLTMATLNCKKTLDPAIMEKYKFVRKQYLGSVCSSDFDFDIKKLKSLLGIVVDSFTSREVVQARLRSKWYDLKAILDKYHISPPPMPRTLREIFPRR